jgi:hypothetical protein
MNPLKIKNLKNKILAKKFWGSYHVLNFGQKQGTDKW